MDISTERQGTTLFANVGDRIDGTEARNFQETLTNVIDDEVKALILDLEKLTYISSAGLRVILLTARVLQTTGRQAGDLLAVRPYSRGVRDKRLRQDHSGPFHQGRGGIGHRRVATRPALEKSMSW